MNKLTIPIILSVLVVIAGVFAFMPVEKASTVHTTILASVGAFSVLSLEQTLPADDNVGPGDGDDRVWTLTAVTDVIVLGIFLDNTPTLDDGLCTPDAGAHTFDDVHLHCVESDYRVADFEIAGSEFAKRGGSGEKTAPFKIRLGDGDDVGLTEFPMSTNIPLEAGQTIVMTLDTDQDVNDIRVNVIFAVRGDATLT